MIEKLKYILSGNRTGEDIRRKFKLTRYGFFKMKDDMKMAGVPIKYDRGFYRIFSNAFLMDSELENLKMLGKLGLSTDEIKSIIESMQHKPTPRQTVLLESDKTTFRFAAIADLHAGSIHYVPELIEKLESEIDLYDFVINAGDSIEGITGRNGQYLELSENGLGVTKQAKYLATELAKLNGISVYSIEAQNSHAGSSNKAHVGAQGLDIGEYLELMSWKYGNQEYRFLGFDNATIEINGLKILLFHPRKETVTSHLEKLPDVKKPHITIVGHHHSKVGHIVKKGVHIIDTATGQATTEFIGSLGSASIVGYYDCIAETTQFEGKTMLMGLQTRFVHIRRRRIT